MEYVTLNNGVRMPLVGFGTFQIADKAECEKSVISAINAGYRLIDTAQAYGNEEFVGSAVKNCGIARGELFITTKLWFKNYERADAEKSLNKSLEKLQLDYVDMVLLHWPYGNVYEAWRTLESFYADGKVRAIGISNFDADRMIDLITFNKIKPCINQIETHLFCQRKSENGWLKKYGVAHQAYAPLGQGRANEMFENKVVKEIAENYGKTPAQIALRFLVQKGISVIPKSVHTDRIKENIDIFDFVLTDEEMKAFSALDTAKPMIGRAESPETTEFAMTW